MSSANSCFVVKENQHGQLVQLTTGSSHHLYFTNDGLLAASNELLFVSDQLGPANLAVLNMDSAEQRLLTTFSDDRFAQHELCLCLDHIHRIAYGIIDRNIVAISVDSAENTPIAAIAAGWITSIINLNADGTMVYYVACEDVGELSFDDHFKRRPRSRIYQVCIATGESTVLYEQPLWLGHCNTSPTDNDLLTFCHEGPWTEVAHRVWLYRISTGEAQPVGPAPGEKSCVGHEYWLANGSGIAYHGYNEQALPCLGIIDVYGNNHWQSIQLTKTKHTHSVSGKYIVGDGDPSNPALLLWQRDEDKLREPITLTVHGGSWANQRVHPHPRFSLDGRSIFFTSDQGGFPQIFRFDLSDAALQ